MDYTNFVSQLREENPFITQADIAGRVIQRCILNNELHAGEKINQEYFANLLGMSRSPIREALCNLEKEGFVMRAENSGYIVYKIRLKDFVDFFEFRIQIESYAAYLAARNISPEQLGKLKKKLEEYVEFCDAGNRERIKHLDNEFHDLIVDACDNPYVVEAHHWILARRNLYIGYFERAGRLEKAKKGHIAIYNAIAAQDEEKAKEAMQYHLKYYLRSLYDIM
ncbi:MAG: GntR family transcriptional regulator [Acetatifactor sp.]